MTCTCSVIAAEPAHEAMHHYVNPYTASALRQRDVVLAIGSDPDAVVDARQALGDMNPTAMRISHPEQRYHVWTSDDQQILVPEHATNHVIATIGDHVFVTAEQPRMAATIGTRVVRQLIMRGGEARGGRCVHAGAVDIDGDGILVGGRPGAGKTSVLTHLVEHYGARPVANDRTVLVPVDGQSWRAVGVPLAWRFTPDGISGSPKLTAALADQELSRGRNLVDGKVEFTPWEVSRLLDCPTVPETRIKRVVVLVRWRDEALATPDETFVKRHLDFGAVDFFADDWLNIRPRFTDHRGELHGRGETLGRVHRTRTGQLVTVGGDVALATTRH